METPHNSESCALMQELKTKELEMENREKKKDVVARS